MKQQRTQQSKNNNSKTKQQWLQNSPKYSKFTRQQNSTKYSKSPLPSHPPLPPKKLDHNIHTNPSNTCNHNEYSSLHALVIVLILALRSGRKQSVTLSFSKQLLHTKSFHSLFLDQHLFTEPSLTLSIHPRLHSSDTTLVAVFQRVWWKGPDTTNSNICA